MCRVMLTGRTMVCRLTYARIVDQDAKPTSLVLDRGRLW